METASRRLRGLLPRFSEEADALAAYDLHFNLPKGSATVSQVASSSLGIAGWHAYAVRVGLTTSVPEVDAGMSDLPPVGYSGTFTVLAEVASGIVVELDDGHLCVLQTYVEEEEQRAPSRGEALGAGRGLPRTIPAWVQRNRPLPGLAPGGRGAGAGPEQPAATEAQAPALAGRPGPGPSAEPPEGPAPAPRQGTTNPARGPTGCGAASGSTCPSVASSAEDATAAQLCGIADPQEWEQYVDPVSGRNWWWHTPTGAFTFEDPGG